MRTMILAIALVFGLVASASAEWVTQLVPETHYVTVHPYPVWNGCGWSVPASYREAQTHYVRKTYWVERPVLIVPAPIIVQPAPYYVQPHVCGPHFW